MKTERELFVEKYRKVFKVDKSIFVNQEGRFIDEFCQSVYEIWQASAQREGYKLVPIENLIDIQVSCEKAFEINNIDIFKGLALAIIDDTKAMIGQANDH